MDSLWNVTIIFQLNDRKNIIEISSDNPDFTIVVLYTVDLVTYTPVRRAQTIYYRIQKSNFLNIIWLKCHIHPITLETYWTSDTWCT